MELVLVEITVEKEPLLPIRVNHGSPAVLVGMWSAAVHPLTADLVGFLASALAVRLFFPL